jgi:hypothetical protein
VAGEDQRGGLRGGGLIGVRGLEGGAGSNRSGGRTGREDACPRTRQASTPTAQAHSSAGGRAGGQAAQGSQQRRQAGGRAGSPGLTTGQAGRQARTRARTQQRRQGRQARTSARTQQRRQGRQAGQAGRHSSSGGLTMEGRLSPTRARPAWIAATSWGWLVAVVSAVRGRSAERGAARRRDPSVLHAANTAGGAAGGALLLQDAPHPSASHPQTCLPPTLKDKNTLRLPPTLELTQAAPAPHSHNKHNGAG